MAKDNNAKVLKVGADVILFDNGQPVQAKVIKRVLTEELIPEGTAPGAGSVVTRELWFVDVHTSPLSADQMFLDKEAFFDAVMKKLDNLK